MDAVLAEFDSRQVLFQELCQRTITQITDILREKSIPTHSTTSRGKGRKELEAKYLSAEKDYTKLDDVPDVAGLRVITCYSDQINEVANVLRREFEVIKEDDKRTGKANEFGYSALHLDCRYSKAQLGRTECKRFNGYTFEIQIATILGHAWAEIHHGWYDRQSSSTPEEERRFNRLAAVLELADHEFLEIRKKKDEREHIASVRAGTEDPTISITFESLKAFIEQKDIVGETDEKLGRILGKPVRGAHSSGQISAMVELIKFASISTIQGLESMLRKASPALEEFQARCAPIWRHTQIPDATYSRGYCVTQLANLLISAGGEDKYKSYFQSGGFGSYPGHDLSAQVAVAKEIVETHRLSD